MYHLQKKINLLALSALQVTGHVTVHSSLGVTITFLTTRYGIVSKGIFFALTARIFWGTSHMWSANTFT